MNESPWQPRHKWRPEATSPNSSYQPSRGRGRGRSRGFRGHHQPPPQTADGNVYYQRQWEQAPPAYDDNVINDASWQPRSNWRPNANSSYQPNSSCQPRSNWRPNDASWQTSPNSSYQPSRGRGRGRGRSRGFRGRPSRGAYRYRGDVHHRHPSPTQQNFEEKQAESNPNEDMHTVGAIDIAELLYNDVATVAMQAELKTYYHSNLKKETLKCSKEIRPSLIRSENLSLLNGLNFNEMLIQFPSTSHNDDSHSTHTLQQRLPSPAHRVTTRIDPMCYDILQVEQQLSKDAQLPNNATQCRFLTYRHNLREIAHVVLYKLCGTRLYDNAGFNVGVYRRRNGSDIILENVTKWNMHGSDHWNPMCIYGYLFEHILESPKMENVSPMNYDGKCMMRDEIRALYKLQFGDDVHVVCAAEMDGLLEPSMKTVELKTSVLRKKYRYDKSSKIQGLSNDKLLKYWTQCYFGGVQEIVIAFHSDGVIQNIRTLKTSEIEEMFPVITSKCIATVYAVLKWLQATMQKLPAHTMHILSFDTKTPQNTQFVLKTLPTKTEQKVAPLLSSKEPKDQAKLWKYGMIWDGIHNRFDLRKVFTPLN